MKTGRNEPCPCGSGKKYKKCCVNKEQNLSENIFFKEPKENQDELPLIATTTGERFHPVRLYYSIADIESVCQIFETMNCMDFDEEHNRWVWLYTKEAKEIVLKKTSFKGINELEPIILGSFFHVGDEIYLDLRSVERAEQAILFFDKYIGKDIAKLTYAAIRHRFTKDKKEANIVNYDYFFPTALDDGLKKNTANLDNLLANFDSTNINKIDDINEIMDERLYPEAEKFPLFFDEEGIERFKFKAAESVLIARERLNGNMTVRFSDVMSRMFE